MEVHHDGGSPNPRSRPATSRRDGWPRWWASSACSSPSHGSPSGGSCAGGSSGGHRTTGPQRRPACADHDRGGCAGARDRRASAARGHVRRGRSHTCLRAAIGPCAWWRHRSSRPSGDHQVIPDFVWRLGVGVALLVVLLLVARWWPARHCGNPALGAVVLVLIAVPVLVLLLGRGRTQEATDDTIWIDMAVGWGLLIRGLLAAGLVGSTASAVARGLLAAAMAAMLWLALRRR